MDKEGLLALFEYIQQEFLSLPLEAFSEKARNEMSLLDNWLAVNGTPLSDDWQAYWNALNTAIKNGYPLQLREANYEKLKYIVDEMISKINFGSMLKKKIAENIVNRICDAKIKQICVEINSTSDKNVLSLLESLGGALKWTLWYRAQQIQGAVQALQKKGSNWKELANLLDKATDKTHPYYSDRASQRFLESFKDNFYKDQYDMVRHDDAYIPDILILNPALDSLEHLLSVTFP